MTQPPIRLSRFVLTVAVLGLGAWLALDALRPWAGWVTLSSASLAIPGQPFPLLVHFSDPLPAGRVSVDLHTRAAAPGLSKVVGVHQFDLLPDQHDYRIDVPLRSDATSGAVRVVVYLSPNGSWMDRTRSAMTDDIPIATTGTGPLETSETLPSVVRRLIHLGGPSVVSRTRSLPMRSMTSALWFIAAAVLARRAVRAWHGIRPRDSAPTASRPARLLGWACLAVGLAEALDVSRFLGEAARSLAREVSAYEAREPGQQLISALALALAAGGVLACLRISGPASHRVACASVTVALGLIALDSLSLHAFDEIAEGMVAGVPWIQIAGFACALITTIAVVTGNRPAQPKCVQPP